MTEEEIQNDEIKKAKAAKKMALAYEACFETDAGKLVLENLRITLGVDLTDLPEELAQTQIDPMKMALDQGRRLVYTKIQGWIRKAKDDRTRDNRDNDNRDD